MVLAIDYRQDIAFTPKRRELFLRLALWALSKQLFTRSKRTNAPWCADAIARYFARVLDPDDLRAFLELEYSLPNC